MRAQWIQVATCVWLTGCGGGERESVPAADPAAHAALLAERFIIVDGHIDVPYRHFEDQQDVGGPLSPAVADFDHPRAVAGGLDAPFLSIYTPPEAREQGRSKALALELIQYVRGIVRAHPDKFVLATSAAEVRAAKAAGRIALLMGMENGSPVEEALADVDLFYREGIRYITLCHAKDNGLCDSSYDDRRTWGGLSDYGRTVVRRMNDAGILIDVSHISDEAFEQVLELSRAPVIASHSSARRFTPGFQRNMSDDMIRRLAAAGGVIMINFGSTFIDADCQRAAAEQHGEIARSLAEQDLAADSDAGKAWVRDHQERNPLPRSNVERVADHIDHVVTLVGVDHVGFGSDFDGVGPTLPRGLEDVSKYPNLIRILLERGYSEADIEQICSGNVLRVMETAERVARGGG